MFKKIFTVWKREGLLKQALENIEEMFTMASINFDRATEELIENLNVKRAKIYMTDRKINECEKNVRRKVLEHLTINPKQDTTYSLIMITVAKDIERIGDYVKNIVELAHHHPKKMEKDGYTKELLEIRMKMSNILQNAHDVFEKGDVEKAKEYYKYYREVTEKTDGLIIQIMDSKDLSVRDAVVYALFSRYLKRISAHLANVLTTVINPFHEVGYGFGDIKNEEIQ
jgi:phosphate transport system protein